MTDVFPPLDQGAGRPLRYDWPTLFNGDPHEVTEFPGTPADFGRQARAAARRYGVRVRVVTRSNPPRVYLQREIP